MKEIKVVVGLLENEKTSGSDGVPAKVFKKTATDKTTNYSLSY
jgi:hypothetical protein